MLLSFNFEVIDLGEGVYPEEFVEAVRTHEPGIVVMCAVHPIGMGSMKDTIDALEEVGLRDSIKVMVGGKPVTQEYAERIKADVYFADIYATAGDLHIIIPISGSKDRWKKLSQY